MLPPSARSHLRRQCEADRNQPGRGLPPEYADGSDSKGSSCNVGDLGSIPVLGRSPGGKHGSPPQYSRLENPMDRGAWWAAIHVVAKSRTRLSNSSQRGTNLKVLASGTVRNKFLFKKLLYIGICPDLCVYAQACHRSPLVSPALTGGFFTSSTTRKAHFGV